jgi:Tfp pilus assembly protein PilN
MQQQINLYRYLRKQYSYPIRYGFVLWVYAIFFALLMIYYSFEIRQKNRQVNTLKRIEHELSVQKQQLAQTATLSSEAYPQNIEQALNLLRQQVAAKNEPFTLLNQQRFSDCLTELAKTIPDGVWLTQIQLMKGGATVEMIGKASQAINAQHFAERLNQAPFFSGKKFEVSDLTYVTDSRSVELNYFLFHIKSLQKPL